MFSTIGRVLFVALAATVILGCQGGGDDKPADDTARPISDGELAGMVLALEQFGREYVDFDASVDSGPRTLDQMADQAFDPDNERADLERFGCSVGYQQFYTRPQEAGGSSGVFAVGTTLCLFGTDEGASGYVQDSREELSTQAGKTSKGVTAETVETFDAQIADEAVGAQGRFHAGAVGESNPPFWVGALAFRHGRLVAVIGTYSYDQLDSRGTLIDLAREMDDNITSVLSSGAGAN